MGLVVVFASVGCDPGVDRSSIEFEPLREEPRFQELVRELNLP